MRWIVLLLVVAAPLCRAGEDRNPLAKGVAAAHPEGLWKVRKADLYRHLVRYYAGDPNAKLALPDYLRRRLIQHEARRRKLTVTDRDVSKRMKALDKQMRRVSGGTLDLEAQRKQSGMSMGEFKRRFRAALLRERVARDIVNKRNKTRNPDKELEESTIVLTIDELYNNAKKIFDPKKLKPGIFAKVGSVSVNEYTYGRELSFTLPKNLVLNGLNDLIVAKEVNILTGNENPPTKEELAAEKEWFIRFEVNRLRRRAQVGGRGKVKIGRAAVDQTLATRGLTVEKALASPGSRAQARARGHFRRGFDSSASVLDEEKAAADPKLREKYQQEKAAKDAKLHKYYEANKKRYGDQLRVATIVVAARAQRVKRAGMRILNLHQGKAKAEAVWIRATKGGDFGDLAKENSDDVDVIKNNGGLVPFWLTADTPGYTDVWPQANLLKEGAISKPFYSRRGGYVLVKLLKRKKALGFIGMRDKILENASFEAYRTWRSAVLHAAHRSAALVDKK